MLNRGLQVCEPSPHLEEIIKQNSGKSERLLRKEKLAHLCVFIVNKGCKYAEGLQMILSSENMEGQYRSVIFAFLLFKLSFMH